MTVSTAQNHTEKEIALKASRFLASYSPNSKTCELKLNEKETITLPSVEDALVNDYEYLIPSLTLPDLDGSEAHSASR